MVATRHRFTDLARITDDAHDLFAQWAEEGAFSPLFDEDKVLLMRLAVHEWLANLVQHADFGDRKPEILLDVYPNGKRVRCVIEDNSRGFDLDLHMERRRQALDPFPDRGMGLLMLQAATEYLDYRRGDNGRHRLEFSVAADQDPWLTIPF